MHRKVITRNVMLTKSIGWKDKCWGINVVNLQCVNNQMHDQRHTIFIFISLFMIFTLLGRSRNLTLQNFQLLCKPVTKISESQLVMN